VAVERVESVLKNCPLAEQVWVYGNSFESCLVAVVVPKEKALLAWADKQGLEGTYTVRPRRAAGLLCMFCSCCKHTVVGVGVC
jgi:long-subunit acyl-CoA synthetase (AMP-forming)